MVLIVLLCVSLFLFGAMMAPSQKQSAYINAVATTANPSPEFINFHGMRIAQGTSIKAFYLVLPLTQMYGRSQAAIDFSANANRNHNALRTNQRTVHTFSLIVTFNNLRYNGSPMAYLVNARVSIPARNAAGANYSIQFVEDVKIGLTNNHHAWLNHRFTNVDFSSVSISLGHANVWAPVRFYNMRLGIFQGSTRNYNHFRGIRTGYNLTLIDVADPDSDNWDIGFGGGDGNVLPDGTNPDVDFTSPSIWQSFLAWATSAFGISTLTVIVILGAVGLVLALTLVRK